MKTNIEKLISVHKKENKELKNFQVKFLNRSNESTILPTKEEQHIALNLGNLPLEEILIILKDNESLATDFFKFELYSLNFLSSSHIKAIFSTIPCINNYIEEVFEYCIKQNEPDFLYNFVCCNSDKLFENQLSFILKKLFEYKLDFDLDEKSVKELKKYTDFVKVHNLLINKKSFILYLVSCLIISSPGVFDNNLITSSLMIEFTDDVFTDSEETKELRVVNINQLIDLFLVIVNLTTLTNNIEGVNFLNIMIEIFINLNFNGKIKDELLIEIYSFLQSSKVNQVIDSLQCQDKNLFAINGILNNFKAVSNSIENVKSGVAKNIVCTDYI